MFLAERGRHWHDVAARIRAAILEQAYDKTRNTFVSSFGGSAMDDLIFHDQKDWAQENTAEALADAITQMRERDLPRLGKEAAERAAQIHAWPRVFERLFCIYREVCANYKGNPPNEREEPIYYSQLPEN